MWKIDIFYSVGLFEEEPYLVARRKLEKGERRNLKKSRNCVHFGNSSWFQTLPAIFWAENREIFSFTLENPSIASFSAN